MLDIANCYAIDRHSKFRGQHVEVEIFVPVGKKISFDPSVKRKLNSIHVKVNRSSRRDKVVGITIDDDNDNDFYYRTGIDYVMGPDGELKDPNGSSVSSHSDNNEYRYNEGPKPPASPAAPVVNDSIQKLIDAENKKKEEQNKESERRIKELQEKAKQSKPTSKTKKEMMMNDAMAVGPSPVSSLVEWL